MVFVEYTATKVKDLFSIPTRWQDVLDVRKRFIHLDANGKTNINFIFGFNHIPLRTNNTLICHDMLPNHI